MPTRARVAMISEHASPAALLGGQDAGGQNVYVDELSRHLAKLGFAVDVFTRRDDPAMPAIVNWDRGVRIVNLDAGEPRFIPKDDLWSLMPAFSQNFLRFMLRDGVRYDVLHGNFWMSGWVAVQLAKCLRVPTVETFHALGTTKKRIQGDADTSPADRICVERDIIRRMSGLIAQCPVERFELIGDYGADDRKISPIPPGVSVERFRPVDRAAARHRIGVSQNEACVVYVGRLLPRKDIRNVVRALARLKAVIESGGSRLDALPRLLVVGGESSGPDPEITPEIGVLQRLADELRVRDFVTFTGQKSPDELRYVYSAADVVVTTPRYEPFGLTPLEAMACARPVIGSAVGGLTLTIEDGRTGFLVPPGDPECLASRIELLLTRPEVKRRMERQALHRVERNFTWTTTAKGVAELYEQLIAERQASRREPTMIQPGLSSSGSSRQIASIAEID